MFPWQLIYIYINCQGNISNFHYIYITTFWVYIAYFVWSWSWSQLENQKSLQALDTDDETSMEKSHTHIKFSNRNKHGWVPDLRAFEDKPMLISYQKRESYFSKMVVCFLCHVSRASSLLSGVTKRETSSQGKSRLMTHVVQRRSAAWRRWKKKKTILWLTVYTLTCRTTPAQLTLQQLKSRLSKTTTHFWSNNWLWMNKIV